MHQVDQWQITVSVEKLLTTLKENRETHMNDYDDAVEAYREAARKLLLERLDALTTEHSPKKFLHFNLQVPVTYEHVYDRVIKMLEMTTDEEVSISGRQFAEWVEDEWSWSHDFASNTLSYK